MGFKNIPKVNVRIRSAFATSLYKVLWEGFPPEIATWEEEDQIPCGLVDFVAQYEAALAAEAAEDASEDESDE